MLLKDGLTKGQDFLFIGTFQDSFQGKIISNYVTKQVGTLRKLSCIPITQATTLKEVQNHSVISFSGEIVADETFVSGDTDFQAVLTKIKDKDFDAIVLPGYYTEAGKIVNQKLVVWELITNHWW